MHQVRWFATLVLCFLSVCAIGSAPFVQPDDRTPGLAAPLPPIPKPDLSKGKLVDVLGVTDGDTITYMDGSSIVKVRLLGVDAPETVDPRKVVQFFGREAKIF